MTVYDFAKLLMDDEEFNNGGIIPDERKYLDEIGFEYTVKGGCVKTSGEDLGQFYYAMTILKNIHDKYNK